MVLKIDSNSEIGAHVRSNLCRRHMFRSRVVTNRIFFLSCVRSMFLVIPSTIPCITMTCLCFYKQHVRNIVAEISTFCYVTLWVLKLHNFQYCPSHFIWAKQYEYDSNFQINLLGFSPR